MTCDASLQDEALLRAVTTSMVDHHRDFFGRAPAAAHTRQEANRLICVLGGVYTAAEQALIEAQRPGLAQQARSAFQTAKGSQMVADIQRLTGRRVVLFVSNRHVDPDSEIELFILDRPPEVRA